MDSISPVWTEDEIELERVCALEQEQYQPIIILPITFNDGTLALSVRFKLTDEERKKITEGGDLIITQLTFGRQFTPVDIRICKSDERPYGKFHS